MLVVVKSVSIVFSAVKYRVIDCLRSCMAAVTFYLVPFQMFIIYIARLYFLRQGNTVDSFFMT